MRRGRAPIPLTKRGSEIWIAEEPRLGSFPVAASLVSSPDLQSAVDAIDHLPANEIAYERAKAEHLLSPTLSSSHSLLETAEEAIRNGASHITSRRLLEQLGVARSADKAILDDLRSHAERVAGLWDLKSLVAGERVN